MKTVLELLGSVEPALKTKVKFKKVHPDAEIPKYAHGRADSGMDLCAVEEYWLDPRVVKLVKTGLTMEIPEGYEAQVRPRSGLALKHSVTVLNSPGTIDSGYRGEIGVILINLGGSPYRIMKGDRIAQLVIAKVEHPTIVVAVEDESLSDSERGNGGFGSTDAPKIFPCRHCKTPVLDRLPYPTCTQPGCVGCIPDKT